MSRTKHARKARLTKRAQAAEAEVVRLRTVIRTGGAMYRAERAVMGIPGGVDPNDALHTQERFEQFRSMLIFAAGASEGAASALLDSPPTFVAERLRALSVMIVKLVYPEGCNPTDGPS